MVKIGGSKKHKLSKKSQLNAKNGNKGKFINFGNGEEYAICIIDLLGWTPLMLLITGSELMYGRICTSELWEECSVKSFIPDIYIAPLQKT